MEELELWQRMQELRRLGRSFALLTVVRAVAPTSARLGAKAIVETDGTWHGWVGGGCARSVVEGVALTAIATGTSRLVRIGVGGPGDEAGIETFPMTCASNGTIEIFVEAVVAAPLVLVAGGTPVALTTVELARSVGLGVAHADEGKRFAESTPCRIESFSADSFAAVHPRWCVVATQGERDLAACEAALASGAERVLLVASRKKGETLIGEMIARGIQARDVEVRLQVPAGISIGAETPEEIALSVVAALVALRRSTSRREAMAESTGTSGPSPRENPVTVAAAAAIDPVCGMAVDPISAESAEYGGRRFYFCCAGCRQVFELAPARYAASAQAERA